MIQAPVLVRRANTVEEADVIAAWLEDAGVKATVVGRESVGVQAFGVTDDEGVGVFVADDQGAITAKRLLVEHDSGHGARKAALTGDRLIVACEECGEQNPFESWARGTVQECHRCGANLDVPGDDQA